MDRKDMVLFQNDKLVNGEQLVGYGNYKDKITTEYNLFGGAQQSNSINELNNTNIYNILITEEVAGRIINRKNRYIRRLERDVDKLSSCICYFNNEINGMHESNKESMLMNYYGERIEELESIIEYKRYKINQIRNEINRIATKC